MNKDHQERRHEGCEEELAHDQVPQRSHHCTRTPARCGAIRGTDVVVSRDGDVCVGDAAAWFANKRPFSMILIQKEFVLLKYKALTVEVYLNIEILPWLTGAPQLQPALPTVLIDPYRHHGRDNQHEPRARQHDYASRVIG